MTCIVGLVSDGRVFLGGDAAGVDASRLTLSIRRQPKVFRNGRFLIGYTSSFRMGQLLEHAFSPPLPTIERDVFAFMVADFAPAVRRCFEAGGWARTDSGVNSGGEFLVGFMGRLFTIEADFQVAEELGGYAAVGCGDQLALGALFASEGRPARERIALALRAAQAMSAGVREPFTIIDGAEV